MLQLLKGWRTVIFNVLAVIVPILEIADFKDNVPQDFLLYYIVVVALGNVYLRSVTTTPVGKK